MKTFFTTILIVFLKASFVLAQWTQVNGPYGHDVRCFTTISNNILAGTIDNGIYISTDTGKTWMERNGGLNNRRIRSLACDNNSIYAGTFFEGVYKSLDLGQNWTELNMGQNVEGVNSIITFGNYIVAGTNGQGIFISSNGGNTWSSSNSGLNNLHINALLYSGGKLFAGTWGGVYLSVDNGINWIPKNSGLNLSGVNSLAIKNGTLYAAGTNFDGVYYSQNDGNSWQSINAGLLNKFTNTLISYGNDIFVGANDGVYYLKNNEFNWIVKNNGLTGLYINSLIAFNNILLAATGDGGVNISIDSGENWKASNIGMADTYIKSLSSDGSNLYVGTIKGGVYIISEGGNECTEINTSLTENDIQAIVSNGNEVFAASNGEIFLSENRGVKWRKLSFPTYLTYPILSLFEDKIYYGGYGLRNLFVSANKGISWSDITPDLSNEGVASLTINKSKILAGGYGVIFSTLDNGLNWTRITSPLLNSHHLKSLLVDGSNIYTGVVTSTNGTVVISRNDGLNWFGSGLGLQKCGNINDFAYYQGNIFIGTDYGNRIYHSKNNGINWVPINDSLIKSGVISLEIVNKNIYVGTQTQGVWKHSLSDLTAGSNFTKSDDEIIIYPNPSDNIFNIDGSGISEISVLSSHGHFIQSFSFKNELPNIIEMSNTPPGIYYLKIILNNKIVFKKIIKY